MNGSETLASVIFVEHILVEEMKRALASTGLQVVDERDAHLGIFIVSIPTDQAGDVELAIGKLRALSGVVYADVKKGSYATGVEDPQRFKIQ